MAICLACDKSQSFHINIYLLFLEASRLISLKCACLAVWNVYVLCLKQECFVMKGPLSDQCTLSQTGVGFGMI